MLDGLRKMDSVTRFSLFLNEKVVSVGCFNKREVSTKGKTREKKIKNTSYYLKRVEYCHLQIIDDEYYYSFKTKRDKLKNRCQFFISSQQEPEFEAQFPTFPYNKKDYFSETLDKKFEIIEQQNIALLSHLETIMIALKLRNADDDNLSLTLPK